MQLEDDVIAVAKSGQFIDEQIEANSHVDWLMLEFSSLGFIGKLFRQSGLMSMITYALLFFDSMPVDLILGQYFETKACQPTDDRDACQAKLKHVRIGTSPSQFRHIGDISSLPQKVQRANDPKLKRANPNAQTRINNVHHAEFQRFYSLRKGTVNIDAFHSVELRFSHLSCFEKVNTHVAPFCLSKFR